MATNDEKSEARRRAEDELFSRQRMYQSVFDPESPAVQEVLRDLAKFCRAHETTFSTDERVHCLQEGRREVWIRITQHLDLPTKKLWELYTGTKF